MVSWSAHHLFKKTSETLNYDTALDIQKYVSELRASKLPVIFSLGHLAKITNINYSILHDTVNRKRESTNYNLFAIRKRSGKRRFIHAVNGKLFDLQKYINDEILQKATPHPASFAFHPSGGLRQCASAHCGSNWILQFDLKDFFYSINELDIFKVFKALGYKNLVSFELSRLCTTLRLPVTKDQYIKLSNNWYTNYERSYYCFELNERDEISYSPQKPYRCQKLIGVLPQGAPTSPMLSNLAAENLDIRLFEYSQKNAFVYTRYADDMTFSANSLPRNKSIGQIKREILSLIRKSGFKENKNKFRIAGPGSKKLVLGLLVDGQKPRISRETLKRIDRHIYASIKFGLEATAEYEKFNSAYGFYNHINGLMSHIKDVDYKRWNTLNEKFKHIPNPFESSTQ